jgi:site-specific recombinase XerD
MATTRFRSFRIYPHTDRAEFYSVTVHPSRAARYEAFGRRKRLKTDAAVRTVLGDQCVGITVTHPASGPAESRRLSKNELGYMLFSRPDLSLATISHEMTHATIGWANVLGIDLRELCWAKRRCEAPVNEEVCAYTQGTLLGQFWKQFYRGREPRPAGSGAEAGASIGSPSSGCVDFDAVGESSVPQRRSTRTGGDPMQAMKPARPLVPVFREPAMLFSRAANDCVVWLERSLGRSGRTADEYDRTYRQFLQYLHETGRPDSVASYTEDTVQGFVAWIGGHGVGPNTIRGRLSALATLSKYLMRHKDHRGKYLLDRDPVQMLERPKHHRPRREFLLPPELQALMNLPLGPVHAIPRDLFVTTGLRVGSVVGLDVRDFVDAGVCRALVVRSKGRQDEESMVPLMDWLAEAIKDSLLARNIPAAPEPLLVAPGGRRWTRSGLSNSIARLGVRAGITSFRVGPHSIRHTWNQVGRQGGIDRFVRSQWLLQTEPRSLDAYEHLMPGELVAARDSFERALSEYVGQEDPQLVLGLGPASTDSPASPRSSIAGGRGGLVVDPVRRRHRRQGLISDGEGLEVR